MTDTQTRILSGLILAGIALGCILSGKIPALILIFLFGIVLIHELEINFLHHKILSFEYFISQLIFVASFTYFGFLSFGTNTFIFVLIGGIQGLLLLYYLFATKLESKSLIQFFLKVPALSGFFLLFLL